MHTIEDCLEIVAGLKEVRNPVTINKEDATIMFSIAKQVFRGLSLSDKQYALMQIKLFNYKDQLEANDIIFDVAIKNLRSELRTIDRSKYVKIIDKEQLEKIGPQGERWSKQLSNLPWAKVRFPFSKKLIMKLDKIPQSATTYYHPKGSHEHYFALTENVAFNIVEQFSNNHFEIDQRILDMHKSISSWQRHEYVPCVYKGKIKNLPNKVTEELIEKLGNPSVDNIHLYYNKRFEYGIVDIDQQMNSKSVLTTKIATRNNVYQHINSKEFPLQDLFNVLDDLDNYPINILVEEENAFDILTQTHQLVRNYIPNNQITVLYRMDSHVSGGLTYNNYIKDNGLNTPVDKDTKIVYTQMSKVNKPLVQSDCFPNTVLSFTTDRHNNSNAHAQSVYLYIEYDDKEPIWKDWRVHY